MVFRVPAARQLANSGAALSICLTSANRIRTFEVKPAMAIGLSIAAALLLSWYLVATLYLVFRDELLAKILHQQTEMQYAYEDRLASMRTHLDRVASRQLVDQDSLEAKVQGLLARQSQLETRQAIVSSLSDGSAPGNSRPVQQAQPQSAPLITGSISAYAPLQAKPLPAPDAFNLRPPVQPQPQKTLPGRISHLAIGLDRIELAQLKSIDGLARQAKQRGDAYDSVLGEIGLTAASVTGQAKTAAMGGPFVPLTGGGNFARQVTTLQTNLLRAAVLQKAVSALPLARPLAADISTSSGFGPRLDPFTRSSAMHTGMDFRAPAGAAVRATAAGKIVEAGWTGGYGNMVEIDHGNGITSRYAHLSVMHVSSGDAVTKGAHIGNVGSTGRSTGAHLHYEVRISDDAVDPQRFLQAGQKLPAAK